MLQFSFNFRILLLQLRNLIVFYLNFLDSLIIFCVCLRRLNAVLLLFLLQLRDHLVQFRIFSFVSHHLILDFFQFIQQVYNLFIYIMLLIFNFLELFGLLGSFLQLMINIILECISLLLVN